MHLSFLNQTFLFLLIVLHDQGISHSQLSPVCIAHHDATSWAPRCRWVRVISGSAAGTPMDEESTSTAHIALPLGFQIKGTRSLNWRVMHRVLAIAYFIGGSRKWSDHLSTLFVRIVESSPWARVTCSIDSILAWSTSKTAWLLIVVVCLGRSRGKRVTATLSARLIARKMTEASCEFKYVLSSSQWWEGLSKNTA